MTLVEPVSERGLAYIDDGRSETTATYTVCADCGDTHPLWHVADHYWNAVVGTPDNPRGRGIVLCPTCFCDRLLP